MTDIAKEYAQALFLLACEEESTAAVAAGLQTVKAAFEEYPEYYTLLCSPSIPLGERTAAAEQAFGTAVPERVLTFVQLMCEKGRMTCFFDAVEAYHALLDASRRISAATVTSAVELTAAEKQKLVEKLEQLCGGRVNATYAVDASLLGGLIVEMDGKVLDGSLRHSLHEMKDVMKQ